MASKNKIRPERVIILILLAILLLGFLAFGIYFVYDHFIRGSKPDENIVNPQPVETNESIRVEVVDYDIYISDNPEIDFNFIIAKMRFVSDKAVSFDLGNLQTSEKIHLNEVAKYINALNEKGYKVSKLGIVNSVVSEEKTYECKVFIPYTTTSSTIRLLNAVDQSMLELDLNRNRNDISALKFDTQQDIEVGNTNVTVSRCMVSTMMLHNDMEYQIPSTMSIYTFVIKVNKVEGNVVIREALFVPDNGDGAIVCLDESYESVKIGNVINKKLVEGENGALFFETVTPPDGPDYHGSLMLKFSNSDDWVKVATVLE